MFKCYLVHYSEIALKGRNRPRFLKQLQENICQSVGLSSQDVKIVSGRLIVETEKNLQAELGRVFGIASFSPVALVDAKYSEIERAIKSSIVPSMELSAINTFAIRALRGDKNFLITSKELEVKLGDFVRKELGKKVDLEKPDVTLYVEVFPGGAAVYTKKIAGLGGLPVGTQTKVAALLSGGIDSPVAAYRIMKRGASLVAIHLHSYPFTSRASLDKVKELVGVLKQYHGGLPIPLYLVPLAEAQKAVVQNCAARLRVLLYRRFMLRLAEALARKIEAQALVTGESLGQVASQTLENLAVTNAVTTLPVFRPLIGYDKEEIIAEAKTMGTYNISIQPHEDCCTLFMPKQVATRARVAEVEFEEQKLKMEEIIQLCLHSTSLEHL